MRCSLIDLAYTVYEVSLIDLAYTVYEVFTYRFGIYNI